MSDSYLYSSRFLLTSKFSCSLDDLESVFNPFRPNSLDNQLLFEPLKIMGGQFVEVLGHQKAVAKYRLVSD